MRGRKPGTRLTQEHKDNISKATRGKPHPRAQGKPKSEAHKAATSRGNKANWARRRAMEKEG